MGGTACLCASRPLGRTSTCKWSPTIARAAAPSSGLSAPWGGWTSSRLRGPPMRLADRQFEFPVERAVYLSVLHRLCASGSDRAAARWQRDQRIPGAEPLQLHHLYRAMRWLGEQQAPIEEALFGLRRDLFTDLTLAFF